MVQSLYKEEKIAQLFRKQSKIQLDLTTPSTLFDFKFCDIKFYGSDTLCYFRLFYSIFCSLSFISVSVTGNAVCKTPASQ